MKELEYKTKILPLKDKFYRFAFSILKCQHQAEDVLQEILIKIWNKRDELSEIKNLEAWGIRLTRNHCLDKLRSKHYKNLGLNEVCNTTLADNSTNRQIEFADTKKQIFEIVDRFSEKQKSIFHLREIDGRSYKEISNILDISIEDVKVNLHRIRKQLRTQLLKLYSSEQRKIG